MENFCEVRYYRNGKIEVHEVSEEEAKGVYTHGKVRMYHTIGTVEYRSFVCKAEDLREKLEEFRKSQVKVIDNEITQLKFQKQNLEIFIDILT